MKHVRRPRSGSALALVAALVVTVSVPVAVGAAPSERPAPDVGPASVAYDGTPLRPGPLAPTNGVDPVALALDPAGDFLYVGGYGTPSKINKVRVSDMAVVRTLTLATGDDNVSAIAIDPAGTFAYAVTQTDPGRVVKIRLSDFTRVGTLTLAAGSNRATDVAIDPAGAFAYVTLATSPGKVAKVRLSDFTLSLTQTLSSGQDTLWEIVLDNTGTYGFVAGDSSPVVVVKLRLSDLRLESAGTMAAGENETRAMVIDPASEFLYLATYTVPSKVVKVRTSNAQRVSAITLLDGENEVSGAAMDPLGEYAYFAPDTSPGSLVKVQVPELVRAGSLVTPPYDNSSSFRSLVVGGPGSAGGVVFGGSNATPGLLTVLPLTGWPGVCGGVLSPYFDIPVGAGYEGAVSCLAATGVASTKRDPDGILRYRPTEPVTRAQMAAFLWRMPGSPGTADPCGFTDQASIPAFAREGACWLKRNGITTENPFAPDGLVTRAQMAAFLWRAAGSPTSSSSCGFTDQGAIPTWARSGACWMKTNGITVVDAYRPADPVTRSQMASFLYRTGGVVGRWTTAT